MASGGRNPSREWKLAGKCKICGREAHQGQYVGHLHAAAEISSSGRCDSLLPALRRRR
jgi:hypothetical protein